DRTISHIKDPLGKLQRLSVAVVVNYRNNDGKPEAIPADELEKLNDLVKQAMGYSAERGDTLSVVNSVFTDDTPASPPIWENPIYLDYDHQRYEQVFGELQGVIQVDRVFPNGRRSRRIVGEDAVDHA